MSAEEGDLKIVDRVQGTAQVFSGKRRIEWGMIVVFECIKGFDVEDKADGSRGRTRIKG